VPLTRLGEPLSHLFWLLSARDDYNWRKKEKESTGNPFKETWDETTGHAIGNYISLLGQRGLIQNITRWARATGTEGGAKAAVASVVGGMSASATMPFLGLQRSIRDMVMGRVDNSSIEASLSANFPVLGVLQDRAINRFGDGLGNQTWYGKIADTGVPIAFQVSDNAENRKLYEMLVTKGIAPPVMRRAVLEEKYGVLSDDQFTKFVKQSGATLKRSVLSNFNEISSQEPVEAKKTLSQLTASADKLAAQSLSLQPVKEAKSSGGGGMTLSGGSSGASSLLASGNSLLGAGSGASSSLLGGGASRGARISSGARRAPRGLSAGRRRLTIRRPRKSILRRSRLSMRRPRMRSIRRRRLSLA